MKRILRGGLAGIVATVAMSLVLVAGKQLGLLREPPPKEITKRAAQDAGANPHAAPRQEFNATWVAAHFGFGAGCGAVYCLIRRLLPGGPAVSGAIYGLLVWGANYIGVLPALGLYPTPEEDRTSRAGVMIAAHLVFGVTLGKAANQN